MSLVGHPKASGPRRGEDSAVVEKGIDVCCCFVVQMALEYPASCGCNTDASDCTAMILGKVPVAARSIQFVGSSQSHVSPNIPWAGQVLFKLQ